MDKGFGVAASEKHIHACGMYQLTADFGGDPLTSAGGQDSFVWKLVGASN